MARPKAKAGGLPSKVVPMGAPGVEKLCWCQNIPLCECFLWRKNQPKNHSHNSDDSHGTGSSDSEYDLET